MNSQSNARRRFVAMVAGVAVVVATGTLLDAAPAYADVPGPSVIKYRNSSDAWVTHCNDVVSGFSGQCLYASNDLNSGTLPGNTFPMNATYLYTLADGLHPGNPDNWVDRGAVLTESAYPWVAPPRNGTNSNHLWAPFAAPGGDFQHYLYVPDVEDNSQNGFSLSSRIGVSVGASPWGPFTYLSQLRYNGADLETYMSDPSMIQIMGSEPAYDPPAGSGLNGSNPPNQAAVPEASRWMIWANGDYNTCGGISMARLDDRDMTTLITEPFEVQISGWPDDANSCTRSVGSGTLNRPYLEGAEIYFTNVWGVNAPETYMMVFAMKPEGGNQYERIMYATSNAVRGPYTIRGTIMASSSSAWTNQASIYHYGTSSGSRFILYYHDGPDTSVPQDRRIHAECLTFNSSGRINTVNRTNIPNPPAGQPAQTLSCYVAP
jgi:hypothetical protein